MICTTTSRPSDQHRHGHHLHHQPPRLLHPLHGIRQRRPSARGEGEGREGQRREEYKARFTHNDKYTWQILKFSTVEVIKGRTPPACTVSAYQDRPAVALLPALDRLHPLPVQFCFWRVCRTAPDFLPDCRRETDAPRPPSIQTPGEPLHFRRPGQFYKLTQYLPSLTYPSIFTRQQPRAFLFYRRENIAFPNQQNSKNAV